MHENASLKQPEHVNPPPPTKCCNPHHRHPASPALLSRNGQHGAAHCSGLGPVGLGLLPSWGPTCRQNGNMNPAVLGASMLGNWLHDLRRLGVPIVPRSNVFLILHNLEKNNFFH